MGRCLLQTDIGLERLEKLQLIKGAKDVEQRIVAYTERGGGGTDIIGPLLTAPSGRQYYRHSSGMGSVMIYKEDGRTKRLLIVDACYRAHALAWDTSPVDLGLINYDNSYINTNFISSQHSPAHTLCYASVTDTMVNNHFGSKKDTKTAKYNTDILIQRPTTDAAHFCRRIIINGRGCDLPNVQQSLRFYCDADFIDVMDATAESNPTTRMKDMPFAINSFYSSTEASAERAWYPYNGAVANYSKARALGVVPVLEISGIE